MNFTNTQMLMGFPIVGAMGGLGLGSMNQYYSQNLYGNSMNDPFIGSNWDFVLTGAALGGVAGLASAGIKYQAQQLKTQRSSQYVEDSLRAMNATETTRKMMALSGML